MNKLDEIALRVAAKMPEGFLWKDGASYEAGIIESEVIDFARAILAELTKDVEPECWGISLHGILCDTYVLKEHAISEFNRRNDLYPDESRRLVELFTHPAPANTAEIEQRVAEAIAKWLDRYDGKGLRRAEAVRNDEWREFL